jgi:lysophospholipase L1-like esterase
MLHCSDEMGFRAVAQSRGALLCAIVLGQFVLFEAGYRLKSGSEAAPAFQKLFLPHNQLGYRPAPGVSTRFKTAEFDTLITINGSGVRDRDIGPRAPLERRVVVLGDSLVMAVQVPLEQTFVSRLEQSLNATASDGRTYRIINAGVQGYGPVEEYLFHRDVSSAFAPDVVVMAIYVGNDAVEAGATAGRLGTTAAGPAPEPSCYDRFTQWRRRLMRRSIVLQVVRLRVTTLLGRFGWTEEIDPPLRTYLPEVPPEIQRGLLVTRDVVMRLKALTESQGSRLVVVLLPARFQVEDGDFGRLREIVARAGKTLERDRATARFHEALEGIGVPVMDALPVLKAAANPASLYFASTAHFTAYGHEVLASALQGFLAETGVLERPDTR